MVTHEEALGTIDQSFHRILMPDAERLADVLEILGPYREQAATRFSPELKDWRTGRPFRVPYGPYCSIDLSQAGGPRWVSAAARPTDAAAAVLDGCVLGDELETISFSVIAHRGTGHSLVIASHNLIIGSHWLAYVVTDSVPDHV